MKINNEQEIVTAHFKVLSWNSPGQLKKIMNSIRIDTNQTRISNQGHPKLYYWMEVWKTIREWENMRKII
jgi:hypothetical protein